MEPFANDNELDPVCSLDIVAPAYLKYAMAGNTEISRYIKTQFPQLDTYVSKIEQELDGKLKFDPRSKQLKIYLAELNEKLIKKEKEMSPI